MWRSLTNYLVFCKLDFSRGGDVAKRNFFTRVMDDLIQSVVAIKYLSDQGIHNTCRRELRYSLELSVKACLISKMSNSIALSFEQQIDEYKAILKKSDLNLINAIELSLLAESAAKELKSEIKRNYGILSRYSHATPFQVSERLEKEKFGITIGFEGEAEMKELNGHAELIYSYIIMLFAHAIPEWVVGDFLVESDGGRNQWYFKRSKYVSMLDERFDYKHERQRSLVIIQADRMRDVEF